MPSDIQYFLYARKSSEEEDRQVQSIPDQNSALLRQAKTLDLQIVDRLEEAHSAKEPGIRPVFASMLERIRKGEANGILCWGTNRLFRNPVDAGEVQWMLQKGIIQSIRTIDREYRPEDNVLLLAVEAAHANQQIIDLSKNVKRGLHEKARRGWWPTKPKPGYRSVIQVIGGRESCVQEPDPDRFSILRRAWEMMLTGAHSVPQILDALESWGYRSLSGKGRAGRPMSRSGLYRLFSDPFYAGRFLYGDEWHEGAYEAMVTVDEFARVQRLLGRHSQIRPQKHEFAFTGLIRCGVCGCMITAERKVKRYPSTGGQREYVYYHCTGRRGCPKNSVSEEFIVRSIGNLLEAWHLDKDAYIIGNEAIDFAEGKVAKNQNEVRRSRQTALDQAQLRLDSLIAMRENQEISAEEFQKRRRIHLQEIWKRESSIEDDSKIIEQNVVQLRRAVRFLHKAPQVFTGGIVSQRRQVASVLVDECVLTLGKLRIRPDPLLLKISRFERPNAPRDMVQIGETMASRPGQRRGRTDMRTLLTEKKWEFNTAGLFDEPDTLSG
ncbi:MAG: recombinase family protein [Fimbriimonadaceae bacterium]|nr:recombinase family protein [Fimbriimonadaceae bacterium]